MDELSEIKALAGITPFKGLNPVELQGSNISVTGNEKAEYQKKNKIEPGTKEWFRLWFARPYLTGENPYGKE